MNASTLVVSIVDDDPWIRKALSRLLGGEGFRVMTFDSGLSFFEQHDPLAAGCVLLDLAMPGMNGIELQRILLEEGSPVAVVFLTGNGDIPSSVRAMKDGAVDFLTKPVDKSQLLAALGQAFERSSVLRRQYDERRSIESLLASLTPREREVLGYLACGQRNKQVAADLGTVEKTIKVHRARILQKMHAKTLTELIQRVAHAGIDIAAEPSIEEYARSEAVSGAPSAKTPA